MPNDGIQTASSASKYSIVVGAIYIFNLIVGTGALAIPAAFGNAGWLTGTVVMVMLAFMSYVTATFTIEAMAAANAILQWQKLQRSILTVDQNIIDDKGIRSDEDDATVGGDLWRKNEETTHLLDSCDVNGGMTAATPTEFYDIQQKVEMGQMATMYFNKLGLILFYVIICIYLYGDLAIYGAAISKTMRDLTCTYLQNDSCNATVSSRDPCWLGLSLARSDVYRIYLAAFVIIVGPFVFCNIQKTKALQIGTSFLRWLAFGIMVTLATIHLVNGKATGTPSTINIAGLPNLFGVCVYSFMCHHSLPSLVTPIANKSSLYRMLALNYSAILVFYLLVALTGVFSFQTLRDLYTLNFEPNRCDPMSPNLPTRSAFVQYFLSLFPVFTLGTNFPIIGITLRNNLAEAVAVFQRHTIRDELSSQIAFPLLAIIPPVLLSLVTEDLQMLVGVTGSFAGVGVQYIIPTMLVVCSQRSCRVLLGTEVKNRYSSPFRHRAWIAFTVVWTVGCITFILINYVISGLSGE